MVKNPPANAVDIRDTGSIPGMGRSPGGGHGNPLQYSCLENPMDRGAWRATVHGVAQSWTRLKQLSRHAHSRTIHSMLKPVGPCCSRREQEQTTVFLAWGPVRRGVCPGVGLERWLRCFAASWVLFYAGGMRGTRLLLQAPPKLAGGFLVSLCL